MQLDVKTLSEYRFARAKEDMEAAVSNHQSGFYKVAINRSYYAIFHAIRAVNIPGGFDASKHTVLEKNVTTQISLLHQKRTRKIRFAMQKNFLIE